MSAAKSERVLNLLIALLSTKRHLTKHELRHMVDGYRDSRSFDRTFERDKKELRDLGITISTGSNDPYLDEEDGYRIDRGSYELPEVEFTAAETMALGLASHTWQRSVSADATADALLRLRAAGAAPDLDNLPAIRAQIPVTEPAFDAIYEAVFARTVVGFDYDGNRRTLQPWRLYQLRGQWLVIGHDVDRDATRRFKLGRIQGDVEVVGPPGGYDIPDDIGDLDAPANVRATIALRDAPELAAGATPVEWEHDLPEGFTPFAVSRLTEQMIVVEACVAGPDAIVLEPAPIR
ncbi:MAG: WYL domain-containing protein, partial [Propionibacterium sp.]|nr:WYL domain-containing protein [Propionibacterium sp.]